MTPINTTINIPGYNSELQYYFFAQDCFFRNYRSPSAYKDFPLIKNNRYHIYIGTDTVKPIILHTPVAYYLQTVDSMKYAATVTDNLGVDSAYIEFKVNHGPSKFIRMKRGKIITIALRSVPVHYWLKGHDTIEYKIFAVDTAMVPNLASLPKTGYFVVPVEEIFPAVSTYSTDFFESRA